MPRAPKKDAEEKLKETKAKATSNVKKSIIPKRTNKKARPTISSDDKSNSSSLKTSSAKIVKKSTKEAPKSTSKNTKKTKIVKVASLASTRKKKVLSKVKKLEEPKKDFANILEYYDLPYRYNETVVKILAQTPKVLFVYWDISDNDREKYKEKYGEYFFNDTYPVLVVHNKTLNYSQEIEINDFANSWYISISDPRSEYFVELGRRFKEYASRNEEMKHKEDLNSLIYVSHSNNLVMPNDHVLLEEIKPRVKYRNVQTGEESYKDTRSILANNRVIDFYELYKGIYQVDDLSTFFVLDNPSSGNPTSTFK